MAKSPESPTNNPLEMGPGKGNGAPGHSASSEAREGRSEPRAPHAPENASDSSQKPILSRRKGQYLIAARRSTGMQTMGLQPLQFSVIEQTLRSSPDIEIVDTVGPRNIMGALADGMNEVPSVLVAKMTDQKAGILHQQAQGRLIVERDHPLTLADAAFQQPALVACSIPTSGMALQVSVIVLGKDESPLPEAEVYLFGSMIPANGITDARGQVSLTLFGETVQSVRGLYVKPKADYWSFYQPDPDLRADEPNVVGLRPLSDWPALANFPQRQTFGWGQKAMRLDQLPDSYRGQGVRIAVIDSGAATTHDDLRKIQFGFDVINKKTSPDT